MPDDKQAATLAPDAQPDEEAATELERLRTELSALKASMEERTRALREGEERFKGFALASAERFWEMDENLRFTWLDEPGRPDRTPSIQTLIGKYRWDAVKGDIDRDPMWRAHFQRLTTRKPFKDLEYEAGKGTDEATWWQVSGLPIFSDTGKFLGYRGVGRDITDRKKAQTALIKQSADLIATNAALESSLQQRDTLLKELQHRVKNSLQVVVSLLNLRASQAPGHATRDAILEASQRVEALSLAHRFLYHPDSPHKTLLSEYIPELCKMLSRAYDIGSARIEVVIDVAPVSIPLSKITPVSLLINELLSNAFKHAFPKKRSGTVSVRLWTEARGEREHLVIEVSDDGIGLPEKVTLETTGTMGLTVFRGLVDQIDGVAEVDRSEGTKFNVRFPLDEEDGV